jgi:hypothetical protein
LQCWVCEARNTSSRGQFSIDIRQFPQETHLAVDIIQVSTACLHSWLNNNVIPSATHLMIEENGPQLLAHNEQLVIGWDHWFKGRISNQWREVYMNDIHSRKI